jgi:hypothetical protein
MNSQFPPPNVSGPPSLPLGVGSWQLGIDWERSSEETVS